MCVRILAFSPSLQISSQSAPHDWSIPAYKRAMKENSPLLDCSDAAGLVSSMYSTPNASSALAIAILVLVSKKAFANCSPSDHADAVIKTPGRRPIMSTVGGETTSDGA